MSKNKHGSIFGRNKNCYQRKIWIYGSRQKVLSYRISAGQEIPIGNEFKDMENIGLSVEEQSNINDNIENRLRVDKVNEVLEIKNKNNISKKDNTKGSAISNIRVISEKTEDQEINVLQNKVYSLDLLNIEKKNDTSQYTIKGSNIDELLGDIGNIKLNYTYSAAATKLYSHNKTLNSKMIRVRNVVDKQLEVSLHYCLEKMNKQISLFMGLHPTMFFEKITYNVFVNPSKKYIANNTIISTTLLNYLVDTETLDGNIYDDKQLRKHLKFRGDIIPAFLNRTGNVLGLFERQVMRRVSTTKLNLQILACIYSLSARQHYSATTVQNNPSFQNNNAKIVFIEANSDEIDKIVTQESLTDDIGGKVMIWDMNEDINIEVVCAIMLLVSNNCLPFRVVSNQDNIKNFNYWASNFEFKGKSTVPEFHIITSRSQVWRTVLATTRFENWMKNVTNLNMMLEWLSVQCPINKDFRDAENILSMLGYMQYNHDYISDRGFNIPDTSLPFMMNLFRYNHDRFNRIDYSTKDIKALDFASIIKNYEILGIIYEMYQSIVSKYMTQYNLGGNLPSRTFERVRNNMSEIIVNERLDLILNLTFGYDRSNIYNDSFSNSFKDLVRNIVELNGKEIVFKCKEIPSIAFYGRTRDFGTGRTPGIKGNITRQIVLSNDNTLAPSINNLNFENMIFTNYESNDFETELCNDTKLHTKQEFYGYNKPNEVFNAMTTYSEELNTVGLMSTGFKIKNEVVDDINIIEVETDQGHGVSATTGSSGQLKGTVISGDLYRKMVNSIRSKVSLGEKQFKVLDKLVKILANMSKSIPFMINLDTLGNQETVVYYDTENGEDLERYLNFASETVGNVKFVLLPEFQKLELSEFHMNNIYTTVSSDVEKEWFEIVNLLLIQFKMENVDKGKSWLKQSEEEFFTMYNNYKYYKELKVKYGKEDLKNSTPGSTMTEIEGSDIKVENHDIIEQSKMLTKINELKKNVDRGELERIDISSKKPENTNMCLYLCISYKLNHFHPNTVYNPSRIKRDLRRKIGFKSVIDKPSVDILGVIAEMYNLTVYVYDSTNGEVVPFGTGKRVIYLWTNREHMMCMQYKEPFKDPELLRSLSQYTGSNYFPKTNDSTFKDIINILKDNRKVFTQYVQYVSDTRIKGHKKYKLTEKILRIKNMLLIRDIEDLLCDI